MRSLSVTFTAAVLTLGLVACDQGTEEATVPMEEELEETPAPQEQIGEQPVGEQPAEEGAMEEEPAEEQPAETAQ